MNFATIWRVIGASVPGFFRAYSDALLKGAHHCGRCGGSIRVRLGCLIAAVCIGLAFWTGFAMGRLGTVQPMGVPSAQAEVMEAKKSLTQPAADDDKIAAELREVRQKTVKRMTERTSRGER